MAAMALRAPHGQKPECKFVCHMSADGSCYGTCEGTTGTGELQRYYKAKKKAVPAGFPHWHGREIGND